LVSIVAGGQDPKSFSEIQPGMLLIGFVKSIKDYGVFVQFPSGLSGLAPKGVSSVPCTRAFEEKHQAHGTCESGKE
jgi:rRNA biogenesis protein RRP5